MMSSREVSRASYNAHEVKKALGHQIPPGCFDASNYSDRMFSPSEAKSIAFNISQIEKARRFDKPRPKPTTDEDCGVVDFAITVIVIVIVIALIVSFFEKL